MPGGDGRDSSADWVTPGSSLARTIGRASRLSCRRSPRPDPLHFVYVDLSERARSWKRGQRGIHLYYMLWQRAALRRARELHADVGFDLVWHLTLANVWMGSVAGFLGPPFIYGPVGGGIRPPWRLAPRLGVRGIIYEIFARRRSDRRALRESLGQERMA